MKKTSKDRIKQRIQFIVVTLLIICMTSVNVFARETPTFDDIKGDSGSFTNSVIVGSVWINPFDFSTLLRVLAEQVLLTGNKQLPIYYLNIDGSNKMGVYDLMQKFSLSDDNRVLSVIDGDTDAFIQSIVGKFDDVDTLVDGQTGDKDEVTNPGPQTLSKAKIAVSTALDNLTVMNTTKEADVKAAADGAIKNHDITAAVSSFVLTPATISADGSLVVTVTLKDSTGATESISKKWPIPKLSTEQTLAQAMEAAQAALKDYVYGGTDFRHLVVIAAIRKVVEDVIPNPNILVAIPENSFNYLPPSTTSSGLIHGQMILTELTSKESDSFLFDGTIPKLPLLSLSDTRDRVLKYLADYKIYFDDVKPVHADPDDSLAKQGQVDTLLLLQNRITANFSNPESTGYISNPNISPLIDSPFNLGLETSTSGPGVITGRIVLSRKYFDSANKEQHEELPVDVSLKIPQLDTLKTAVETIKSAFDEKNFNRSEVITYFNLAAEDVNKYVLNSNDLITKYAQKLIQQFPYILQVTTPPGEELTIVDASVSKNGHITGNIVINQLDGDERIQSVTTPIDIIFSYN